MTDTSRGDPDVRHRKKLAATAGERRRAPTRIRRAREDRPRPEGMGDDRLRLAARARRRVFDQAQHDADRQPLERRAEAAAAVRRGRRRRPGAKVEPQGEKEGSRTPRPFNLVETWWRWRRRRAP